jgi:hypothetical protein
LWISVLAYHGTWLTILATPKVYDSLLNSEV